MQMTSYYNENDPFAAAWLRELIKAGLIAQGDVDARSIEDVLPSDLAGYTQHHFFAGIGGWSYALRLAGWPDDRPVWTGSCPCQPFSQAGKGKGFADERHLWPTWHWLIEQCSPATVFGEQVASGSAVRDWLSLVQADMEGLDYAFGAANLPACSVGAPHLRQRIFWVADLQVGQQRRPRQSGQSDGPAELSSGRHRATGNMAHPGSQGLSLRSQSENIIRAVRDEGATVGAGGLVRSPWRECDWIQLSDGTTRPVEPGTHPLAYGFPERVGLLRGFGNAIVPQVAAAFIGEVMGDGTC